VYDSGSELERIIASQTPEFFNAEAGDPNQWDHRSDERGPEPEAAAVGTVNGKLYAFIGPERAGSGVLAFDLSDPAAPQFVQYIRTEGDISTEGLLFVPAEESPNGQALVIVSHEISNTVTIYAAQNGDGGGAGGDHSLFLPRLDQ
jgi:hypothetical protein